MAIHNLNAKQVESAKPKTKEYNLTDGGGLTLRIKPVVVSFGFITTQRQLLKNVKIWGLALTLI